MKIVINMMVVLFIAVSCTPEAQTPETHNTDIKSKGCKYCKLKEIIHEMINAMHCKYCDVKEVLHEIINVQEAYIHSLRTAKNGNDVVNAINRFSNDYIEVSKKMMTVDANHPELQTVKDLPQELMSEWKKFESASRERILSNATVFMKHGANIEVQKAFHEMDEKLKNAGVR